MTDYPITPPPELVQQWDEEAIELWAANDTPTSSHIATRAAQWGADQELEACCAFAQNQSWGLVNGPHVADVIRAARRPKPQSLKELALALVEQHEDGWRPSPKDWDTIRRALEALPDSIVVFPSQC